MKRSAVIAALALHGLCWAGVRENVEQGRLLYGQGKFEEACDAFQEAAVDAPGAEALLQFNQAATYYKRQDYDKAIELYTKALGTRDLQLEAAARYNLGNCHFQQAVLSQTELGKAMELLQKAMSCYHDAAESLADPQPARYNLEKSKLLMKDLLDRQKKQDEEKKKKQGQDQKNEEKKEQQEQDQQNGDKDQQKEGQQKQGEQKEGEQKDEPGEQKQEDREQQLSPEDAAKLLNAIREKQRENEREERVRKPAGYAPVDKDW